MDVEKITITDILGEKTMEDALTHTKPVEWAATVRGKLTKDVVEEISKLKGEPEWMRQLRVRNLELFNKLPMPNWVAAVNEIDLEELINYAKPSTHQANDWDQLPSDIKSYYESIGLPELEAKALSGLGAQLDSEIIYLNVKKQLNEKGVILMSMEEAVQKYPDMVRQYFMKIFPPEHKFAALHGALWSGGVFVYVPPGVKIEAPLEAFFLISNALEGQFEHTLLVADKNSYIHFIEGCSAPRFSKTSFHDGMVELYAHEGAHIKFTTVQNWSKNVINFNNKRAIGEARSFIEWVEASIGSRASYVYPSTVLKGEGASTSIVGITMANGNHWKENGAKVYHDAPNTSSKIVNKSISANGGSVVYRGLVFVRKGAKGAKSHVVCDSLVLDSSSKAYTIPHDQVFEEEATVTHEATTGRISEDKLYYLRSRGFTEDEAKSLVVLGFIQDVTEGLPFEYAMTLNKVISMEFSKYGKLA
ncbi:Fe-S cluster assembly protein SufB [Thermocladium modestius]|uniref:Fe-S cluster assembly protein SufB n=1 Tax=Thermocladium modestius TaxID=62609 RepID=A0A830GWV0_9CREN|nr:Fe-S cluster assembly protein SufB [Thermocladium modestius]GGP21424.1 Fe-S cluster assembly protein SufB [Thermocladium modestius]